MKKLLIALLLVPFLAHAKGVAYMPNDGGGRIVITDEPCYNKERTKTYPNMWRVYTFNKAGATTEGCFEFEDTTIHVFWPEHQKEYRYAIEDFIRLNN